MELRRFLTDTIRICHIKQETAFWKPAHSVGILADLSQGLNGKHLAEEMLLLFICFILTMGTMTYFSHSALSIQALSEIKPKPR